jgi:hypothetical protein
LTRPAATAATAEATTNAVWRAINKTGFDPTD